MAKVLVAFLAGFAIATPSTYWLLKKVRIKSKVRHFQVSTALGMPVALFIYLLQTSYVVPVIVITVVFSLLVAALELTLRRVVANSGVKQPVFKNGPNGGEVPFSQARVDSGCYPYDYMTESVWTEMQEFIVNYRSQSKTQTVREVAFQNEEREKLIWGYQKNKQVTIHGGDYSILNGVRGTTDYVCRIDPKKIFIFGGSTVFGEETPDRLTIASFLQRKLNLVSNSYEVVNNGWAGASIVDRSKMLKDLIHLNSDDLVVFYMGDNDSGWHFTSDDGRKSLSEGLLPAVVRAMKVLGVDFGLEIGKWIYFELSPRGLKKFSRLVVNQTINAITQSEEYCRSRGASLVVILQPNLYTLGTKSPSESQTELRFSGNLKSVITEAYHLYRDWISKTPYAVSATHIFNNAAAPVFLDWAHVNARGNELIAKFIFEELKKRKLISVDEEV